MNVYFPNGQMGEERLRYKLRFYDVFLDYIGEIQKKGIPLVLTGDFNTAHQPVDLAEPEKNARTSGFLPIEREKIDLYLQHNLVDIFRVRNPEQKAYTYWSYFANARIRNLGWRIDYFFVDEKIKTWLKSAFILDQVVGSDHCPVGIEIER